jgi:hypothetical protein
MISSASSQQRLSDSTVIVPIKSLKNALLVKADRDNLKKELVTARDSISTLSTIILRQDSALFICDTTRVVLEGKIKDQKGIIKAKDGIIEEKDKHIAELKTKVRGTMAALFTSVVVFLIALL